MSASWPPPPDLASLKELLANADIEGLIANGAPPDEYDTEAEKAHATLKDWSTTDLTAPRILPFLEEIWSAAFGLGSPGLDDRRVKLRELAGEIERFFGAGASPQVRGA